MFHLSKERKIICIDVHALAYVCPGTAHLGIIFFDLFVFEDGHAHFPLIGSELGFFYINLLYRETSTVIVIMWFGVLWEVQIDISLVFLIFVVGG